jgi:hypothetical protein
VACAATDINCTASHWCASITPYTPRRRHLQLPKNAEIPAMRIDGKCLFSIFRLRGGIKKKSIMLVCDDMAKVEAEALGFFSKLCTFNG